MFLNLLRLSFCPSYDRQEGFAWQASIIFSYLYISHLTSHFSRFTFILFLLKIIKQKTGILYGYYIYYHWLTFYDLWYCGMFTSCDPGTALELYWFDYITVFTKFSFFQKFHDNYGSYGYRRYDFR